MSTKFNGNLFIEYSGSKKSKILNRIWVNEADSLFTIIYKIYISFQFVSLLNSQILPIIQTIDVQFKKLFTIFCWL